MDEPIQRIQAGFGGSAGQRSHTHRGRLTFISGPRLLEPSQPPGPAPRFHKSPLCTLFIDWLSFFFLPFFWTLFWKNI